MKFKLKITLIVIVVMALVATLPLFSAFNIKVAKINSSFIESSTYKAGNIEKSTIVQENISFKDNSSINTETVLSRISENLDKEINNIHNDYKAKVLGSTTDSKATDTNNITIANPPANLNDFESAILYLINTVRASNGLGALQADQKLTDIARSRCNDMITNSYFSHYTPDGRNIFNIFRENGVTYVNGGENLGQSSPASSGTPEAFMNAWMASPTHKANILRSVYSKIGIGVSENGDRRVVTTVFTN